MNGNQQEEGRGERARHMRRYLILSSICGNDWEKKTFVAFSSDVVVLFSSHVLLQRTCRMLPSTLLLVKAIHDNG